MRYWTRPVHLRYEAHKRVERLCLWIAHRLPGQLRMWVAVDATNVARRLYPHPTGYAGPDGLGYEEIHDGALREQRPERSAAIGPRRKGIVGRRDRRSAARTAATR